MKYSLWLRFKLTHNFVFYHTKYYINRPTHVNIQDNVYSQKG